MKKIQTHPYTIVDNLYHFLFILIIPLIQQILYLYTDIFNLTSTITIEISILLVLIAFCLLKYKAKTYTCNPEYILIRQGIFFKSKVYIPYKNIFCFTLSRNIIPALFGANRLDISTGYLTKHFKTGLYLSKKRTLNFINIILPNKKADYVYKAPLNKIILMATSWSNPAKGLIIIAPFINKLGKILGQEITGRLYYTFDIGISFIAKIIPPIFATITYIIIIGWLIAIAFVFSQYANFKVVKTDNHIIINTGVLNSTQKIIDISKINAVSIRQTLLMSILNLSSAGVSVFSNRQKNEQNLLIAASDKKSLQKNLYKLLGINIATHDKFCPPKKAINGFIAFPLTCIILLLFIVILFSYNHIVILLTTLLFLIFLYLLIIRILEYKNTYIALKDDKVFISGCSGLSIVLGIIPKNKIQYVKVSKNPLQRFSGLSNIKIYIKSDKKEFYVAKLIKSTYVENFVETLEKL